MPQPCSICTHPDRTEIDALIVAGQTSNRAVASHSWSGGAFSKDSVARHRGHISGALARVKAEREEAGARTAVERAEELYRKAERVLDAAESEGKATLSLAAIRELRGLVELLARMTGELDDRPQVAVVNLGTNPDFLAMLSALMDALAPFPEARQVVAGQLELGGPS